MKEGGSSFWSTLPGILTAIGGIIGAVAALLTALYSAGMLPIHRNSDNQQIHSQAGGDAQQKQGANGEGAKDHDPPPPGIQLSKQQFSFPGDGTKNNNQSIGPFCCTGETATITKTDGTPIGYIYFYDFADAVNLPSGGSGAGTVKVLVSSESTDQPGATQLKSEVSFDAANAGVGSVRTASIGVLKFTAKLRNAPLNGGTRYDMGSVAIEVDVETLP